MTGEAIGDEGADVLVVHAGLRGEPGRKHRLAETVGALLERLVNELVPVLAGQHRLCAQDCKGQGEGHECQDRTQYELSNIHHAAPFSKVLEGADF